MNYKVLATKQHSVDFILLHAHAERVLKEGIVSTDDPLPEIEGVDGADTREGCLGVAPCLGMDLEDFRLDLGVHSCGAADDYEKYGHHADYDQGELPPANEGNEEGGDQSGDGLHEHAKFFTDPRLYQLPV